MTIDIDIVQDRLEHRPREIEMCEMSLSQSIGAIKGLEDDIASASDVAVMDATIDGKNKEIRVVQMRQVIENDDDVRGLKKRLRDEIENRDMLDAQANRLRREHSGALFLSRVYAAELNLRVGESVGLST